MAASLRSSWMIVATVLAAWSLFAPDAVARPTAHHPGVWTIPGPWPGRSTSVQDDGVDAVHMALLRGDTLFDRPHSQVLAWGSWFPGQNPLTADGGLWAWNPSTSTAASAMSNLTPLPVAPPYDLFCAGHSTLANGDLLVIGGTERNKTGPLKSARFVTQEGFKPNGSPWVVKPMVSRRWYGNGTAMASSTAFPDGGVLATAGNSYWHMAVFGGRRKSDLALTSDLQLNQITDVGQWDSPVIASGTWPEPREGQSLADQPDPDPQVDQSDPCYLFGGLATSGLRNDAWQLKPSDTDTQESYSFTQVVVSGPLFPTPRWHHAAVVARNPGDLPHSPMYVHGGEGPIGTTKGDLWKLEWSAPNWVWSPINPTGSAPSPRSGHAAVWDQSNNRMILFGGADAGGNVIDANVYVLTFPSNASPTWTIATPAALPGQPIQVPDARAFQAMTLIQGSTRVATGAKGVLFGGVTTVGLSDELWKFTVSPNPTPTVTWSKQPHTAGATWPAARKGASLVAFEQYPQSYIVFGGELGGGGPLGRDALGVQHAIRCMDPAPAGHFSPARAGGVLGAPAADVARSRNLQPHNGHLAGVWTAAASIQLSHDVRGLGRKVLQPGSEQVQRGQDMEVRSDHAELVGVRRLGDQPAAGPDHRRRAVPTKQDNEMWRSL